MYVSAKYVLLSAVSQRGQKRVWKTQELESGRGEPDNWALILCKTALLPTTQTLRPQAEDFLDTCVHIRSGSKQPELVFVSLMGSRHLSWPQTPLITSAPHWAGYCHGPPHTELDRFFFFSLKLFSCCRGSVVPLLCSQGTVLDRHGIWQQALSSLLSVAAIKHWPNQLQAGCIWLPLGTWPGTEGDHGGIRKPAYSAGFLN